MAEPNPPARDIAWEHRPSEIAIAARWLSEQLSFILKISWNVIRGAICLQT